VIEVPSAGLRSADQSRAVTREEESSLSETRGIARAGRVSGRLDGTVSPLKNPHNTMASDQGFDSREKYCIVALLSHRERKHEESNGFREV